MSAHATSTFPEVVLAMGATAVGTATKVYTVKSPNFACVFAYMDTNCDACDGTDKMAFTLSWSAAAGVVTQAASATPDVVVRTAAVDSAKSPVIAANTELTLTLTPAGTAANILGISWKVVAYPTDIKRGFSI